MTIGIFLTPVFENDSFYLKMNDEIYNFLKEKNINIIGITSKEAIKYCDGVILQGGQEFLENELEGIKYLYEKDIPTLGICMGMQLMGLAFSGKIEKLPNKNHKSNKKKVHQIQIKKGSNLASILKVETGIVNSRHEEALTKTSLKVVAYSNDGVIEAIEDDNKKFFIGVEWHPESDLDNEVNKELLNTFLEVCKKTVILN